MYEQFSLFDGEKEFKIDKPIRLIELFAGYGSQSLALDYLGVDYESWRICEWAVKSIQAYKDIHFPKDNVDYSYRFNKKELVQFLLEKGISANYNEPMTREQIYKLKEEDIRNIYNNIIATHNMVSVVKTKATDLEIKDVDKYCYIMTYSFPCQDLSLAGQRKGMEKGSGTRSGLLWEVERILKECEELPQVLVMENVPQVHNKNNAQDFIKWQKFLESLGYKNKWADLNSKDFGIPQSRNRCFMVSVLGNYFYNFPEPKELELKLKDMLEPTVDESFYLSAKKIESISKWKAQQDPLKDIDKEKVICPCITARGAGEEHSGMILINEKAYEQGNNLKEKLCNKLIKDKLVEEGDVIRHSYTKNRLNNGVKNMQRVENKEKLSPTLDTRCDCLGVVVRDQNLRIRKMTPKECFRLMGVKDSDYNKVAQNQSNASLYHLAGDSIVVDVLMNIFNEML